MLACPFTIRKLKNALGGLLNAARDQAGRGLTRAAGRLHNRYNGTEKRFGPGLAPTGPVALSCA